MTQQQIYASADATQQQQQISASIPNTYYNTTVGTVNTIPNNTYYNTVVDDTHFTDIDLTEDPQPTPMASYIELLTARLVNNFGNKITDTQILVLF